MVVNDALAMLVSPPPTVALLPLAVLVVPPPTVE
jgi:hypothetical protein